VRLNLRKLGGALVPAFDSDSEVIAKWRQGDIVIAEVRRPRNGKFHAKFFALLDTAFHAQDRFPTLDSLRFYVTVKSGYFDSIETKRGVMIVPKSISFAAMGEDEFSELYDKAIDVLIKDVLPDKWTGDELKDRVDMLAEFAG
jgi:hypothetical protein